jgi:hypothetical protein
LTLAMASVIPNQDSNVPVLLFDNGILFAKPLMPHKLGRIEIA